MTDRLQEMLDAQLDLQRVMPPLPNRAVSDDPQTICEFIKDMVLATESELHELLDETGWKPWSSSWHVNTLRAQQEWIDAWHFMMNLANKLGLTAELITELYHAKHAVNRKRQEDGYDGVSTKCAECHTELSELEDKLTIIRDTHDGRELRFCSMTHRDDFFLGKAAELDAESRATQGFGIGDYA